MLALRENIGFLQFLNFTALVKGLLIDHFYRRFRASYLMFGQLNGGDFILVYWFSYHFILVDLTCKTESRKELTKLFASLCFRVEVNIAGSAIFERKFHRVQQRLWIWTSLREPLLNMCACKLIDSFLLWAAVGDEFDFILAQFDLMLLERFRLCLEIACGFRFCIVFYEHLADQGNVHRVVWTALCWSPCWFCILLFFIFCYGFFFSELS